jgi:hypothetical protein
MPNGPWHDRLVPFDRPLADHVIHVRSRVGALQGEARHMLDPDAR